MSKSNGITRKVSVVAVVMSSTATTAVTTPVVAFDDYASGGFSITSTAAFTGSPKIAFKVCESADGTFKNLYSSTGGLVEVTAAVNNKAYPLPDQLFGWPFFKMWLETSGTGIAQATIKTFTVVLKS